MRTPFMFRALALAGEAARLRRDLERARNGWLRAAIGWKESADGWADCLTVAAGWQARAEILYALVEDRDAADDAMRAQDRMEEWLRTLEEVDP